MIIYRKRTQKDYIKQDIEHIKLYLEKDKIIDNYY